MYKLEELLYEIAELLRRNDELEWSKEFFKLHCIAINSKKNYDPEFLRNIKSLFKGMGSFRDLVLHKNSKPLIEENNQLEDLKTKLYEKCNELRFSTKFTQE